MAYIKMPLGDLQNNIILPESTYDQIKKAEDSDETLATKMTDVDKRLSELEAKPIAVNELTERVDTIEKSQTTIEQNITNITQEVSNKVTAGTTDLVSGTSPLESGTLYVVYK